MLDLSQMSNSLTNYITNDLDYNEDKKEIVAYAIETALISILGALLLITFAFVANALKPALIAAVFGVLLRRVSGGAHFSTPMKCLVFGAIIYTALGVVAKYLVMYNVVSSYLLWVILLICLVAVAILAPVDSENKPIHSQRLKRNLKGLSIGFVLVTFVVCLFSSDALLNVSMCLGVLYQSLTLLPIFNRQGGG